MLTVSYLRKAFESITHWLYSTLFYLNWAQFNDFKPAICGKSYFLHWKVNQWDSLWISASMCYNIRDTLASSSKNAFVCLQFPQCKVKQILLYPVFYLWRDFVFVMSLARLQARLSFKWATEANKSRPALFLTVPSIHCKIAQKEMKNLFRINVFIMFAK